MNDDPVFDTQVAKLFKPRSIAKALSVFLAGCGSTSVINSTAS
ncbi:hypothetical protein [Okeania sp. KiyG1]|nr:hypothetical protein [Okeania sp. KiyG1]